MCRRGMGEGERDWGGGVMAARFFDHEHGRNPLEGCVVHDLREVRGLLHRLREMCPPSFVFELRREDGLNATCGLARRYGTMQHARHDGMPPFLLAARPGFDGPAGRDREFLCGGTPTPFDVQHCMPFGVLVRVLGEFVETGGRSGLVEWIEV